jgi:hypothetical protein
MCCRFADGEVAAKGGWTGTTNACLSLGKIKRPKQVLAKPATVPATVGCTTKVYD